MLGTMICIVWFLLDAVRRMMGVAPRRGLMPVPVPVRASGSPFFPSYSSSLRMVAELRGFDDGIEPRELRR